MTPEPLPATGKPDLDELLATIGVSRAELTGMTADDLFAAAARWQDATATAAAKAMPLESQIDRLLDSIPGRPAGLSTSN